MRVTTRLVFVATLLCALDAALHAQVFDVATVKLTPADQVGPIQPSIVQFLPNGFRRTNSTLRTLVRTAYDVQEYQVTGGPDWADRQRFDIEARHTGGSRSEVLRMLQALLVERFQLTAHRETKAAPTFDLVRVKDAKLPDATSESTPASVRPGQYSGKRSMAQLAQYLGGIAGRPVADRTGLAGNFDLQLSFAPDLQDSNRPSLQAALREQLGLRLEPSRGPVEIVIIDRANLPGPN